MAAPALPHPATGTDDLLRRVQLLEIAARKNAAGRLAGAWVTSFHGSGLLFHEARKYVPGDPVRNIDWNLTARAGEPYVRVYLEERRREVVLLIDVSPSMHTGFTRRTKLETAVELAATLAVSAVEAGDRIGCVLFADRVLAERRPRAGRRRLLGVLETLLRHIGPWRRPVAVSDPRQAIHALEERRGGPRVVFLISDFLDRDVPEDLAYLRARHDVSLLQVYDPFEVAGAPGVAFAGRAPEGAATGTHWASPGRPGGTEAAVASFTAPLREACAGLRLAYAPVSTADDVPAALARLFHERRRRRL